MEKIDKQEIKNAREAYNRIVRLDDGLYAIVNAKQELEEQVRSVYRVMQNEMAEKELQSMDVGVINSDKEGIRVASLRSSGIITVGQLGGKSPDELSQISGIGDIMAKKIVDNVETIRQQTAEGITVRLSAEDKSNHMTAIIRSLHSILCQQTVFVQAQTLYAQNHDEIVSCGHHAKLLNSSLKWLFASRQNKESALADGNKMVDLLNSGYGEQAAELIKTYQNHGRGGIVNPRKEFEKTPAPYYVLLENIIEGGTILEDDADRKKMLSAMTGGSALTQELIENISQLSLSLDLLKANLRRYQVFGTQYILHQEKVLLGDEMGLGKTMQAIAAFCHLKSMGGTHFLVVCPLSVVVNWTREIQNNSELNVIEVYGDGRDMEMTQWMTEGGVAITTYETLNKVPVPETANIDLMVVDEAHYIKNPQAHRTQSVLNAAKKAEKLLLMSGTPLENRVEEMQFLIHVLRPDIADRISNMKKLSDAKQFREAIAPVYLRRVREDVLKELPELVEKEQWGIMNVDEKKVYTQALRTDNFMQVRQLSWNLEDISKSTKANRLLEIYREAKESNRKLLVFSFFKGTLQQVANLLNEDCIGVIDGSVPNEKRQEMIDRLANAPAGSALVCQIQAGGVGLNIQSANVVIFCEPQMKPSLETQAVARAYRMGQSHTVMVHRLLIKDSVDERVMELLHNKAELFENFADDSVIGSSHEATMLDESPVELQNEKTTASMIMKWERERLGMEEEES